MFYKYVISSEVTYVTYLMSISISRGQVNLPCLISRTLIFILSASPILGLHWNLNFPTEIDVDEAYRLTSWINNETSRDMIMKYLVLCPEQDMCLGPMFKRNFTFTKQPACTPCECDDSCVRRSTCCPSKFYRQTVTPDYIEYQDDLNVIENEMPLSCMEPLWNPKGIRSGQSYWMVETCPKSVKCVSTQSKNISIDAPVTSLDTHTTFLNVECAKCNYEEISNLVAWEKKKICVERPALFSNTDFDSLYLSIFSASPICNIGFYPPSFLFDVIQQCVAYTHESSCNESNQNQKPRNRMRSDLTKPCHDFYLPYILEEKVYKNIYCALCEYQLTNLPIQYNSEGLNENDNYLPNLFSALIDFQQISDEPIKENGLECGKNQIMDTYTGQCLDIQCEEEYMYHDQSCNLIHKLVNENNYEINLVISPVDDRDLVTIDIFSISVEEALSEIIRHNNLELFVCKISFLGPPESDMVYMAIVIELSIDILHNIDKTIDHLLKIFESYHLFEIPILESSERYVNVSLTTVGQSFRVFRTNLFGTNEEDRVFLHPISRKKMKVYQIVNLVYYGNAVRRSHCLRNDMASTVADWYRCPKVKVKSSDVRLNISNFAVCLLDNQSCFASNFFKESLDKNSVSICLGQYLKALKISSSALDASTDNVMASLSLACLSLSSLGSVITIFSFFVRRSCSRIADVNIITISVFLILANTARTGSLFFDLSPTICIGAGIFVHFCWLSVVCWIGIFFFEMFQTLTPFCISKIKGTFRVLYISIVNLIICSSLVAINVTVSFDATNGDSLGYSVVSCHIADPDMILYTFALPVGLSISINTLMFAVMMSRIFKRVSIQISKDDQNIGAYFWLSNVTGATWLFGFLAQFTGYQLFDIVHNVLNCVLGFFLYVAFGKSPIKKQIHRIYWKDSNCSTPNVSQK